MTGMMEEDDDPADPGILAGGIIGGLAVIIIVCGWMALTSRKQFKDEAKKSQGQPTDIDSYGAVKSVSPRATEDETNLDNRYKEINTEEKYEEQEQEQEKDEDKAMQVVVTSENGDKTAEKGGELSPSPDDKGGDDEQIEMQEVKKEYDDKDKEENNDADNNEKGKDEP